MEASAETKQPKYQNEFENVQSQNIIEVITVHEPHNTYAHAYHTLQYIDEDQEQTRLELLQGNPILPPGKHLLREQPHFRLKFTSMREKFNKTSFEKPGKSLKDIKGQRSARMEEAKPKEDYNQDIEDIQYMSLLETRKLVYKRINNSKINCIGKDRVLCSVFFDWRKQKVISKNQPIFQYLLRAKKLRCKQPQKDWLTFNSNFQSGNLLLALKDPTAAIPTYQLYMQNDVNTKGCTQWYYFSAIPRGRGKVKLRIMNFYKPTSLYQKGMKILFSYDGVDWKRTGTSITYGRTSIDQNSYSLDFLHDFQVPEKETYFAYGYPYNYSEHLSDYVNSLTSQVKFQRVMRKSVLCTSSMGNPIHILHISNYTNKKQPNKQLIYIIGRQHPGETPASYIVEGLINFLLSNCGEARQLRDRYEFRVVPMVNVDGVISGNYRSNISGTDINRQWQFPSKKGHPEVFWLKQEIGNNKKQTAFFLDIHAHSRKMNSFFYGSKMHSKQNRLYPFICSKMNKFISYGESAFTEDPSKKTTARVILESQFSIPFSLTYEVSFYGWTDPVKQTNISFKQGDLRQMGESLGIGFYYSLIGMQKAKEAKNNVFPKFQSEKEKVMVKNSIKLLQKWNKQLQKQVNEEDQAFSEGSSLNPQHFQLKDQEKMCISEMMNAKQEKDGKNDFSRNLSTPKDQKKGSRRKILIYSSLEASQNAQESKLLAPRVESEQKNLGISSNQFYHFSSTARGAKKQPFSVRQLQLQLQIGRQVSPQKKLRGLRLKMGQNNQVLSGMDRYESLDIQRHKNYKNDVLQMKKALKYLLQSKTSDYDQYKSCFKSFNNDLIGLQKHQRYHK